MRHAQLSHDLFMMHLNLSGATGEEHLKNLYIESVNAMSPHFRLSFVPDRAAARGETIDVATAKNHFGLIDFDSDPEKTDETVLALVRNSVKMLALFIEKQRQDMILSNEKMLLEEAVADKTRELEQSRLFSQRILETTPDMIYIYDLESKQNVFSNKGVIDILGFTKQQIKDMGDQILPKLIHPDDIPAVAEHHHKLRHSRQDNIKELSYRIRHADGSWQWLYSRDLPFSRHQDGRVRRILGIAKNISEEIRAHKQKLIYESQLRQSHKMEAIGTMAGGIAHDFNNILGIILGNSELAMEEVQEWSPARESLKEIKQASIRAREIVRQLLSFTRGTRKRKEVVEAESVISETLRLLRASIPSSVTFNTRIEKNAGMLEADVTQIHQILINLCTNAVHAMAGKGQLDIHVSRITREQPLPTVMGPLAPGEYLKISIADTGTGIAENIQDKIFDPYFTTKEVGKGTGMGLAVVQGIVKNHDGGITLSTVRGEGTLVTVLLPATREKAKESPRLFEGLPCGSETILFVDDEPSLGLMVKQTLSKLGYQVETYTNPELAYDRFAGNPDHFNLVISDMTMPGMTGDQLARKILEIDRTTPIMLCSGFSNVMTREKARDIGVAHYLEKPFEKNELASAIRKTLDENSVQRRL